MTHEEEARVVAAISAAIRYIEKDSTCHLGKLVNRELRAAIGLITQRSPDKP